jgi:2,4-dienoyl-CoA reductase-like NADH-dependent reductase (Old Yellow Enzyme family)/thioredoxin reductase
VSLEVLLTPFDVKGVAFRNRIVSTAHAPGYAENGMPGERYQRYHEEKAKGGLALTMFGGSSIVSPEVSPIYNQIDVSTDAIIPHFKSFAKRIHDHGAKLMCQISHMGRRTAGDDGDWIAPIAPSSIRDPAHHGMPRAMEIEDIDRVISSYGDAAQRCAEGQLDGCEVFVPSHLPGQFLAPNANTRTDEYGGSLENRMRFLRRILETVRQRTGSNFLVSLRMAIDESQEGGPSRTECLEVAKVLHAAGLYDILNLIGLAASTTWGISRLIGGMAMPLGGYLEDIASFRKAVGAPVIHAGRIADLSTAAHAIESGAVDMVGMMRAHMADPHIVSKLIAKTPERIRPCVGAAYCIDRIYAGRAAFCLHNPATGREIFLPQTVKPSSGPKRDVVVIGGGPAGLEAARVAVLRGHRVTLLEASSKLGGQLLIASQRSWRRDLIGIVDWLAAEIERLGVRIHTNTYVEAHDVQAQNPDIVIVATGGLPRTSSVLGSEHVTQSWESQFLNRADFKSALIYDEDGGHAAISLAQHLAAQGIEITIATNDRVLGRSLGGSNYPIYLAALAEVGTEIITDHRLSSIAHAGNSLRVTLRHEFGKATREIVADRVFTELGTEPADQVFHDLKSASRNSGVTDVNALKSGTAQPWFEDGQGGMLLFRVGDAVASRDVHAAMLDSLRLMKDA